MSSERTAALHGTRPDTRNRIQAAITGENFAEWYREHVWSENIREGKSFFNGPSDAKPPKRHSPSQLLQCPRKAFYRQLNAPEETGDPDGIFWFGSELEEQLIMPFLEDVAGDDEYVTNSMWISFVEDTEAGEIEFRGATDPVIVNRAAEPLVLTEVKSKRSLDEVNEPDERHKAQVHAYMRGLTTEYDRDVHEAAVIYVSRTTLDLTAFHVEFDQSFWSETVLNWAKQQTSHQENENLPPANPRQSWECDYCSYQERCGQGSREISDVPVEGLIPLIEYPRQKLREYLEVHDGKLTPTTGYLFPELARTYGVYDWWCRGCGSTHAVDEVSWNGDTASPPRCPECKMEGRTRFLKGPMPEDQGGEF